MKKIFLFVLFFTLVSCGQTNTSPSVDNASSGTSQTAMVGLAENATIGTDIAKDAGYNQCIVQSRYECGNKFIQAYALNNSSTDICEQFGDENLQTACKEMVIIETAKKTLDADRCHSLADEQKVIICRQEVIMLKGVKNSDPTVCSNLELSANDTDTLENTKDRCVMHIINQLDPTEKTKGLCGLLINEEMKVSCETQIQDVLNAQAQA